MAVVTVRAHSGGITRIPTGATRTFTFPGTPQVGDIIIIASSSDANPTMTTPSGWTLGYSSNNVNGSKHLVWKVYASGDGSSVNITWSADPDLAWAIVVLDGSAHTGLGTFGTITTRGATSTTSSAVATGSSAVPNLVVFHEKAASHASAPTVSPTTTTIENQYDTAASGASLYIGSYDTSGGTADRTATYSVTSTNGAGVQIPANINPAAAATSSGTGTATATVVPTQNVSASSSGTGADTATVVPTQNVSAASSGTGTASATVAGQAAPAASWIRARSRISTKPRTRIG